MKATSNFSQRRSASSKARGVLVMVAVGGLISGGMIPILFSAQSERERPNEVRTLAVEDVPVLLLPQDTKPISAEDALAENESLPFSSTPVERAPPLVVPLTAAQFVGRRSAIDCLTAAIYYEAAQESETGKRGVAQVVLNRARHPAFPNSICGVVYQGAERRTGCQFTFTCDGSLARQPSRAGWSEARRIALAALSGYVEPRVGMATHYHADYVVPYWAPSLAKIVKIDRHIFYRWSGGWGRRAAFNQSVNLEQFFDDQPQIEELAALDTEPTLSAPYQGTISRGARLAADETGGSLADADSAVLPRNVVAPSIKADETPAKLAADNAIGSLKVD